MTSGLVGPRGAPAVLTAQWRWAMLLVWLVGLAVRLPALARDLRVTNDVETLRGWAHVIAERGLVLAYDQTTVNYPPVYVYWLAVAAQVEPLLARAWPPLDGLTLLVKLPALAADLLTAAVIGRVVGQTDLGRGVAAVAAYLFNPAVWYVSSYWGQVDALYTFGLVLAVVAVQRGALGPAWLAFAVAVSTKPQAVCLAPLLVLASLRGRGWRGLAAGLAAGAVAATLLWAPWLANGQWAVLRATPLAPLPAPQLSVSAYNAWYLLRLGAVHDFNAAQLVAGGLVSYQTLARAVYLLVVGGLAGLAWRRRPLPAALLAAALALAFLLFMPDMRERYLFPLPALLLLLLAGTDGAAPAPRPVWLVYAGVSVAWLFNLVTIASSVPGWWVNLVVPQPETPVLPALRLGALLAAGLLLVVFGWLVRRLALSRGAS